MILHLLFYFVVLTLAATSTKTVNAQWRFCQDIGDYTSFYCESRGFCLPITDEGYCACAQTREACAAQVDQRGIPCRWNNSYNVPNRPLLYPNYESCLATEQQVNFANVNFYTCKTSFEIIYRCVPGLNVTQKEENRAKGIANDDDISNDRKNHPCQPYDTKLPTLVAQPYLFLFLGIFKDLLVLVVVGVIGNWLARISFRVTQALYDLWNFSWDSKSDANADDLVFYIHDVPFSTRPIRNPRAKNRRVWSFDDYCSVVAKQLFEKRATRSGQRDLCDAIAFVLVNEFLYIDLVAEPPLSGRLSIPPFVPWTNLVNVVSEVLYKSASRRVRYGLSASALVRIDVALNQFPTPPQLLLYLLSASALVATTLGSHAVESTAYLCPPNLCSSARSLFQYYYFLVGYSICNSSLMGTAVLVWLKTIRAVFFTNDNDMVANRLSVLILRSSRPVFLLLVLYILLTAPFLLGGIGGGFFFGWPGPVLLLAALPLLLILYFIRRCFLNYIASIEMKNLQQFQRRREYSRIHSDLVSHHSRTQFVDNTGRRRGHDDDGDDDDDQKQKTAVSATTNSDSEELVASGERAGAEKNDDDDHGASSSSSSSPSSGDDNDEQDHVRSCSSLRLQDDAPSWAYLVGGESDSRPLHHHYQNHSNAQNYCSHSSTSPSSSQRRLGNKNKNNNSNKYSDDDEDDDDDADDEQTGELAAFAKDRPHTKSALDFARKQQIQEAAHSKKALVASQTSLAAATAGLSENLNSGEHCDDEECQHKEVDEEKAGAGKKKRRNDSSSSSSSSPSSSSSCTIFNIKFLLRALIRFLLTEEILVIIFSFVFQASFSYTALLAKKAEFGIEQPSEVFALDFNARKVDCVIALLNERFDDVRNSLPGKLQHISFALPFV